MKESFVCEEEVFVVDRVLDRSWLRIGVMWSYDLVRVMIRPAEF